MFKVFKIYGSAVLWDAISCYASLILSFGN